ncbi:MAG: NADH-quinone oxidoreductase subunit N [Actinomycetota bacterium]
MIAQLDTEVARPEIVWGALLPILTLGVGALLLILFRSLMKQLPAAAAEQAVPVIGAATVVSMWIVGGFAGTDIPLAGLRDDVGDGVFYVGLAIVMLFAAWLARYLDLSVDAALTVMIGLTSLVATWQVWVGRYDVDGAFGAVGNQIGVDGFSLVITGTIAAAIVLVALLLDEYLEREHMGGAEMYVLMLFSGAGGAIMASANDLIVLFLALETLSIAVYVMAAMHMRRSESQEAGLKYFVLGAFSSAFLLYGIALTYGATGSTNLIAIEAFLAENRLIEDGLLMAGFAMLLVGLGFKVAAAPFHAWTPDVYQGAPTPVVAYMASAVKAAGFAALVRVFVVTFAAHADDWQPAVYALAILTLVVGSFMAIVQRDAKRMLAYSSISHAGFILVGVQAASDEGISSVAFYAVAYTFLVIGSFGVLSVVSGEGDRSTSLDDLDGLSTRRPALALALTIFLLAQAGVPFTSGFVAKFQVIGAAVEARSYWLAIAAMVTAVVSAFLYLRIVLSMYLGQADDDAPAIAVPRAAGLAILLALVVTVGYGVLPGELDSITRDAIPELLDAGTAG